MKIILIIFFLLCPFLVLAEYNGVHVEFKIQLLDGSEVHGYKYIAHYANTEETKTELENNLDFLLRSEFTYEPGDHIYYSDRVKYKYQEHFVFRIINPIKIELENIKQIEIIELILSSYAVQLVSDHTLQDSTWMKSAPIFQFGEDEEMCSYDIFIHQNGKVSNEVISRLKSIIEQSELEIKEKEKEMDDFEGEYGDFIKDIFARIKLINEITKENENLKTVVVSQCTC